jgi:hypothetical protein
LAATVTELENGTQYWFRVAAVNKAGRGEWAVVGSVMPLPAPTVTLAVDSGLPGDGITNTGRIDVGIVGGSAWQYRIKGGEWTSPSRLTDRWFVLAPGKYAVGDVRVRQGVVGSTSPEGFNDKAFDIDTVAPTLVRFASETADGTYGVAATIKLSATLTEPVQAGGFINVTLNSGAPPVTLTAAKEGVQLTGEYTVAAGQNSGDLSVDGYMSMSVVDLAGNPMRSTLLPPVADNIGGSKAIVVDTLPPVKPVISGVADDVAPAVGNVPNSGFTNDTVLVINGTTELGSKVQVYDGATLLGSATVTNNQWTFTTSQLANKTYAFKAHATDGSDNVSEDSFVYTVTVDTSAPSRPTITGVTDDVVPIVGIVPDGGVTNDTVLVISGTTEDGSTVQIFNGASLLGSATVSGTGWTFTAGALADGSTYTFKARATDRAGNVGVDSAAYTVTIDTTGAATLVTGVTDDFGSVQGNIPNGGSTDDTTLVVSGSTEEGSTVQVFNGTTLLGSALVQGRGWTFTTGTLVNRTTYSFKSQATDRAGNVGPQSTAYVVTIDTDAPDAPVITGLTGGVLSGTVEAGCTVQVFAGATLLGTATTDGTKWSIPLTNLLDGSTYTFTAKASDAAGNVGPESAGYTVTIDLTPPKPIIAAVIDDVFPVIGVVPNAGSTNDTILELTGTTESGSTVQVFNGTTLLGSANVDGATWSFVTPALIDGATYEFIARATDASNNQGSSPVHRVTIDTAPPMVRRFSSTTADGFYASGRQATVTATLSEAVQTGSSIVVTLDTKAKLTLTAPTSGTTLTGIYTVQPGDNSADLTVESFTVNSVTDFAGNVLNSLSVPTGTDNLGGAKNIAIDTTSPSILSFTTSTAAGAYGAGTAITLTAVASETLQAGSRIAATLNTGAMVTLTAVSEGTSLIGTYTVPAGHNASNLAVVAVSPVSGGDRAGNPVAAVVPATGNLRSGIAIDTVAPTITKFDSTSPNGTYRPGSTITIRAFTSEVLQAGATVNATLSSGAVVALSAVAGQTLSGSYTVQPGEVAADLDVVSMTVASGRDLAGNALAGSIALPAGNRLAEGHDLVIDGSITALTPAGFSSNPLLVPDLKRTVTSIPIKFTAPVTGVTIANFRLLYSNRAQTGGRSLSLRGATLTGSGTDYVLRLPSKITSMKGIYTLQIVPSGIFAAANGKPMTESPQIFWGKGRSIGMAAMRAVTGIRR